MHHWKLFGRPEKFTEISISQNMKELIEALFLEFGDSSLNFRVRCWIEHYVETRRIIDKMNTAIYLALNENGIQIPFPQREIRLLSQPNE